MNGLSALHHYMPYVLCQHASLALVRKAAGMYALDCVLAYPGWGVFGMLNTWVTSRRYNLDAASNLYNSACVVLQGPSHPLPSVTHQQVRWRSFCC